jgi:hypothetical protein
MNSFLKISLVAMLTISCEPSHATAEQTELKIPLRLDDVGVIETPYVLELQTFSVAAPNVASNAVSPANRAAQIAREVLNAARQDSYEQFAKLSAPGLSEEDLQSQFANYRSLMSSNPDLTLLRSFAVGSQFVFTALFPSGRESEAVLLQCSAQDDCRQNLSLSFDPIPQTILFALREQATAQSLNPRIKQDPNRTVRINLFGDQHSGLSIPVFIKTGELYASRIPSHEAGFKERFGCSIQSVLDTYFDACEQIGTPTFDPRRFSTQSLARVRQGMRARKRPPDAAGIDFVSPLSDRILMLLVCPAESGTATIGFVSLGGASGAQILNYGSSGKIDQLLGLPTVKAQLVEHWRRLKKS